MDLNEREEFEFRLRAEQEAQQAGPQWSDLPGNALQGLKEGPQTALGLADVGTKLASLTSPVELAKSALQAARGTPLGDTNLGEDVKAAGGIGQGMIETAKGVPEMLQHPLQSAKKEIIEHPISSAVNVASLAAPLLEGPAETAAKYAGRMGENQMGKLHGTSAYQFRQLGRENFGDAMRASYEHGDANLALGDIGREQAVKERIAQLGNDIGDVRQMADEAAPKTTRLYRVEPKDLGDKGAWLQKHLTPEQYQQFVNERGRLFSDTLNDAENYGHGQPTHNTFFADVPEDIAKSAARPNPRTGAAEYLLPPEAVAKKGVWSPNMAGPPAAGMTGEDMANAIRERLSPEYAPSGVKFDQASRLQAQLDSISKMENPSVEDFAQRATDINTEAAKNKLIQPTGVDTDVANQMAHVNDEQIAKRLPPELQEHYQLLKEEFGNAKSLNPMELRAEAKEATANQPGTMFSMGKKILHSAVGGPKMGAQVGFGAEKALQGLSANAKSMGVAGVTSTIMSRLSTNPQGFGKFASPLVQAAQSGGAQGIAAIHYILSQQYPEYNEMFMGDKSNESR